LPEAPASAPAPASVVINIKVEPAEAQVRVDGATIAAPFSGEFRQGATLHRIEASASGYEAVAQLVPFDADRTIEIVLERSSGSTRRVATRTRGAPEKQANEAITELPVIKPVTVPEPPAAPAIVPGADISSVRSKQDTIQIDTADPYATGK
jgi:hypothetical protein